MQGIGTLLGGLDERTFLSRHWQRRPLLVRGALSAFRPPLDATKLRALAGDATVPSRLVVAPRTTASGRAEWATRRGPFGSEALDALPDAGWTILLHELDRRIPALRDLLERFRFIPNWRVDDTMVSYATDGGGVGPHIDRYDVFLVQVSGKRRWRIATSPLVEERFVAGLEHPVLAEFAPDEEWILEPGDLLYLPPRHAHDGVAVGEGVTCSIGFRTPDPRELCAGYLRQLGPAAFDAIRFTDAGREPAEHAGEIPAEARRRLRESALSLFADARAFDDWLGRLVTAPPRPGSTPSGSPLRLGDVRRLLDGGGRLERSAPPHFAWQRDETGVRLFVGGEAYALDPGHAEAAEILCGRGPIDGTTLGPWLDEPRIAGVVLDSLLRGYLRALIPPSA